jgi:two-component system alkaline phosphatase synthesis response regulator PhoP
MNLEKIPFSPHPGKWKRTVTTTKTILVVDDKASVRSLLRDYLTAEGFRVVTADNGRQALFAARHEKPDLIILDIMMPEMGGYEFMRLYTKESDTPIILLTAKLEESDKVLGLELGADDYVTKPFGMRELVARIRAVLRRLDKSAAPAEILRAAGVTLDQSTRLVQVGDQAINLTPTEFDLLATLMSAPGRVFSRQELLQAVQGVAFEALERSINVHISNLRAKIEPDPDDPRYIETVFGVGYRFCVAED